MSEQAGKLQPSGRAELLAFIEEAYARGLTRDQVADAIIAHGFTVKQVVDALPEDRRRGWRVMDDAELLEFLKHRDRRRASSG
jgi:hypothetical protein